MEGKIAIAAGLQTDRPCRASQGCELACKLLACFALDPSNDAKRKWVLDVVRNSLKPWPLPTLGSPRRCQIQQRPRSHGRVPATVEGLGLDHSDIAPWLCIPLVCSHIILVLS